MANSSHPLDVKTGHNTIDTQHQELFHLVSLLDQAIDRNSREYIEKLILFLEQYVNEHFQEEEAYMISKEYKEYAHHKEDHEIFKARVFSLRHDFDSRVSEIRLFFALRMFIDKLVYHIRTVDVGIAELVENEKNIG